LNENPFSGPAAADDTSDGFSRLTAKQLSILVMIARGLTNREIAYELHMSKYTVAQHIKEMLKRTGAVNRTDLINRAHITGILNGRDSITRQSKETSNDG
jgi:DNA-binding NarL/FixJ family response regulator